VLEPLARVIGPENVLKPSSVYSVPPVSAKGFVIVWEPDRLS